MTDYPSPQDCECCISRRAISAVCCVVGTAAISSTLAACARSWFGFSAWWVAGYTLYGAAIGGAIWRGWVRMRVACGCLGVVILPSLGLVDMCSGILVESAAGATVGVILGTLIDRRMRPPAPAAEVDIVFKIPPASPCQVTATARYTDFEEYIEYRGPETTAGGTVVPTA